MDSVSASIVSSSAALQTYAAEQGIQIAVQKAAMNSQALAAAALIQALPQPALASSGSLGTLVNTFA